MTMQVRTSIGLALFLSACTGGVFKGESKKTIQAAQSATPEPQSPSLGNEVEGVSSPTSPLPQTQPNVIDNGIVVVPPSPPPVAPQPVPPPVIPSNPLPQPVPPPVAPQPVPPPVAPQPQPNPPLAPEETAGQAHVPSTCFVNMEHGYHGTDENFIVQLVDGSGVVAAGHASVEAVRNGTASDGSGAYPGVVLNFDLSYVRAGAASGSGQLNICYSDPNLAPEKGQCQAKQGQFGGDGERPTSVKGASASWTVANGANGKPEFKVAGNFNLSTHHPVWAYAAPGKCFKDFQSPIVLDLNKNGRYDLIDVWNDRKAVRFDLMADGQKIRTGWIESSDALLALDRNGNGKIDDGLELFGEYTKRVDGVNVAGEKAFAHGFEALAQYDADRSGAIDSKDPIFGKLVVWQDKNSNGQTDEGELRSLGDVGVISLSLAYAKSGQRQWMIVESNEVRLLSTYTAKDGKEYGTADVWFKQRRHSDGHTAQK